MLVCSVSLLLCNCQTLHRLQTNYSKWPPTRGETQEYSGNALCLYRLNLAYHLAEHLLQACCVEQLAPLSLEHLANTEQHLCTFPGLCGGANGRTGREGRRGICNTLHHGIKTHNNCNLIYTYVTCTPHGHHGNKVPSHTRKPRSPSLVHHSQYAERRGNVLVVMAAVCL